MTVTPLLFVCEGNICRSPMTEMTWNAVHTTDVGRASSAGVRAFAGEPIDPRAAHALGKADIPLAPFAARQVTPVMIRGTTILTMTRRQRQAVAEMSPASYPRIFTLRELAGLAKRFPDAPLSELHRRRHDIPQNVRLDITNPVRQPAAYFLLLQAQIDHALRTIAVVPDLALVDAADTTFSRF